MHAKPRNPLPAQPHLAGLYDAGECLVQGEALIESPNRDRFAAQTGACCVACQQCCAAACSACSRQRLLAAGEALHLLHILAHQLCGPVCR